MSVSCLLVGWLVGCLVRPVYNAELSPKRYWRGDRDFKRFQCLSRACWLVGWLAGWLVRLVYNAELSPKRYWRGPRFQEVSVSVSCFMVGWLVGWLDLSITPSCLWPEVLAGTEVSRGGGKGRLY